MEAHNSTVSRVMDGPPEEVVEVLEVVEVVPTGESLAGTIAGSRTLGGRLAAGKVMAAGVDSSSRDWTVPVTSAATSATFQRRSEAAGSRRRRRVTSHATPKSTVLWIRYVRSHASRVEARGVLIGVLIWVRGRSFRRARSCRGSWRCHPGSRRRPRAGAGPAQ